MEVHELAGRTPVIVIEVPAFGGAPADDTVVLYGHLDKQPEMHGWRDGLGPWTPVLEGDRLYGRGGADDGYAAFASLAAIEAVRAGGGAHARCVVLIEASEESGSPDLPAHVEALADRIGTPSFVVCLDSGCIDYDRMWLTTSLRGIVNLALSVDIVRDGLHSGESGMIPSTFRIARVLLSRIEDEATGRVLLDTCDVTIPDDRARRGRGHREGDRHHRRPLPAGRRSAADDARRRRAVARPNVAGGAERDRRRRSAADRSGGQRAAPEHDARAVAAHAADGGRRGGARRTARAVARRPALRRAASRSPPAPPASGWNAPPLAPWLVAALDDASVVAFGQPTRMYGVGGTIPFMGMLGERFPEAQFAITGVLGPDANAHGPNEYLHLPTARKITLAIAELLNSHANR